MHTAQHGGHALEATCDSGIAIGAALLNTPEPRIEFSESRGTASCFHMFFWTSVLLNRVDCPVLQHYLTGSKDALTGSHDQQPSVKAFECTESGCRVRCTNDKCNRSCFWKGCFAAWVIVFLLGFLMFLDVSRCLSFFKRVVRFTAAQSVQSGFEKLYMFSPVSKYKRRRPCARCYVKPQCLHGISSDDVRSGPEKAGREMATWAICISGLMRALADSGLKR